MKLSSETSYSINTVVIVISLITWVILLFNPGQIMTVEHCHVSRSGPSAESLSMLLAMNPIQSQLVGWLLMVIAMMLPKLIGPIQHIYVHSFKKNRFAAAMLFVLGYILVWTLAGIIMILAIIAFQLYFPDSFYPAIAIGVIAIVWQFSPIKQRFLNQGHNHHTLSAFGFSMCKDSLSFGIAHGISCVGSGWALMLFPMLLPVGHNLAMIVVTFIMLSEHMEFPQKPEWKVNLRLKLFRIIANIFSTNIIKPLKIKSKNNMKYYLSIFFVITFSITFSQEKDFTDLKKKKDDQFHSIVLHEIFSQEFDNIANISSDLSSRRFFANLSNENNKLSLGANFALKRKDPENPKITWITGVGFEMKSKDNFATVFKNGDIQNEINGIVNFGRIGNGIITIYTNEKKAYLDAIKHIKKDSEESKADAVLRSKKIIPEDSNYSAYREMYKKRADLIRKHKLYKRLFDWSFNLSLNIPISSKEYLVSESFSNENFNRISHYPFSANFDIGTYWKCVNKKKHVSKLFLNFNLNSKSTNNIEFDENFKTSDFLSFVNQSSGKLAISEKETVYIGSFERFLSFSVGAELVCFPFQEIVGFSGGVSFEQGQSSYVNWKLGIPFSLNDKEQKPVVNFELQYKEFRKNKFVGLKVGFVIGKFIG